MFLFAASGTAKPTMLIVSVAPDVADVDAHAASARTERLTTAALASWGILMVCLRFAIGTPSASANSRRLLYLRRIHRHPSGGSVARPLSRSRLRAPRQRACRRRAR